MRWLDHFIERRGKQIRVLFLMLAIGSAVIFIAMLFLNDFSRTADRRTGSFCCACTGFLFAIILVGFLKSGKNPQDEISEMDEAFKRYKTQDQELGKRIWDHDIYDENAYAVLDLRQDATPADIRKAYRKLSKLHHPDVADPEDKERATLDFVHITKAYELLIDPHRRRRYDAWIELLNGDEPTLDDATRVLNDPEAIRSLDGEVSSNTNARRMLQRVIRARPADRAGTEAEEIPTGPRDLPATEEPQVDSPKDESPPEEAPMLEIEMPLSVREALGMEPVAQIRTCERCGLPWDGTNALCDSCSEGT